MQDKKIKYSEHKYRVGDIVTRTNMSEEYIRITSIVKTRDTSDFFGIVVRPCPFLGSKVGEKRHQGNLECADVWTLAPYQTMFDTWYELMSDI